MRKITLLLVLLAALALSACSVTVSDEGIQINDKGRTTDIRFGEGLVVGSGKQVTREYELGGFTAVDIANAFRPDISRADSFSIVVTIDDNVVEYLRVDKEGSTLRVYLESGNSYTFRSDPPTVKITMPALDRLTFSGAVKGTISGFQSTRSFSADLSGASSLKGSIQTGNARFEVSGASSCVLQGAGQDVTADISGASTLDLGTFTARNANVSASGASKATINASGKLDYELSGASRLIYAGNPTIGRHDTSGASSATRQ